MTTETNKDFMLTDDMLLDDIDDLPSFGCWPSGAYRVSIPDGVLEETINDHPAFKINLTLLETKGIVDEESVEEGDKPKPGAELGLLFMRDNKFGAANYKSFIKPIALKAGVNSVAEANQAAKGMEITILLNKQQDKKDKTKFYPRVMEVMIG